eukprot:jgi/Botrbrau1/2512/Bobra.0079s0004.1
MGSKKRKVTEIGTTSGNSADCPSQSGEEDSTGIRPPTPVTEHEVERMLVPENLLQEEERLRNDRENNTRRVLQEAFNGAATSSTLDDKKFLQLENLLNQTNMYTEFLQQQMGDIETLTEVDMNRALDNTKAVKNPRKSRVKQQKAETPTQALVPLISGELRDYQLKGIKWMISLWSNGINGILGDQMGLGKTVRHTLRSQALFWLFAPLSTLPNWVSEFKRWCPSIPVVLYHGNRDERTKLRKKLPTGPAKPNVEYPVYVTSYEIVMADVKFLSRTTWKYLVVDEGHRLKNFNCRLLRELRTIPVLKQAVAVRHPSAKQLDAVNEEDGGKQIVMQEQRNKVVSKLHKILRPFLLRRIKSDVEASVPPKAEIIMWADMTAKQRMLNESTSGGNSCGVHDKTLEGSWWISWPSTIKVEQHPDANAEGLQSSGPDYSWVLMGRSPDLSQMTKMLDLLDAYLHDRGHDACRIDGSISYLDRQAAIEAFNTDPSRRIFLLSTRAGGLGINLTAADTVIIYDSDWNPHQDSQAMDRCHRIGQQKPVLVFRLATAHSVEGKMLRRAASKLKLERLVIKKGAFLSIEDDKEGKATSMSAEELMDLLKEDTSGRDKPQSGVVSDQVLDQLLDRDYLLSGKPAPYKPSGIGYELVQVVESSGLLSRVE